MVLPLRFTQAARVLQVGGVVACPTEAVWGLSCDADDEEAVERILALKNRPRAKGLILVGSSMEQFAALLGGLDAHLLKKLKMSWPGPNTWLVPHQNRVPDWVHGEHSSVAIRVTAHPGMIALCEAFGSPLVSTSANPAGYPAPTERFQVIRFFGDELDAVLPGSVGAALRPSIIRDLYTDEIVRP
ncbi:MAG: L-threonylcarbamoyladenylate synthase [Halioglobus sp.]